MPVSRPSLVPSRLETWSRALSVPRVWTRYYNQRAYKVSYSFRSLG